MYYSKDIESFGTGLKRIAEVCEEANVRYEFQKLKNGFVVCFYRSSYFDDESTGKVRVSTGIIQVNRNELSEAENRILNYLMKFGRITNKEVCNLLNVKDSRAYKILKNMNQEGIIKKEGSYRDSYYRIAEDTNTYRI